MQLTHNREDDTVTLKLEFEEAIGLYKMALGIYHPGDSWSSREQLHSTTRTWGHCPPLSSCN